MCTCNGPRIPSRSALYVAVVLSLDRIFLAMSTQVRIIPPSLAPILLLAPTVNKPTPFVISTFCAKGTRVCLAAQWCSARRSSCFLLFSSPHLLLCVAICSMHSPVILFRFAMYWLGTASWESAVATFSLPTRLWIIILHPIQRFRGEKTHQKDNRTPPTRTSFLFPCYNNKGSLRKWTIACMHLIVN